jgi:hypothetical protein
MRFPRQKEITIKIYIMKSQFRLKVESIIGGNSHLDHWFVDSTNAQKNKYRVKIMGREITEEQKKEISSLPHVIDVGMIAPPDYSKNKFSSPYWGVTIYLDCKVSKITF